MGCGRRFLSTDPDTQTRVCRGVAADRSSWRITGNSGNGLGHYPQRDQSTLASGATSSQADTSHVMQGLLS